MSKLSLVKMKKKLGETLRNFLRTWCILASIKHNRLNVGRINLERLVGALINCSLLQSGGGEGLNGTKNFNI